METKTKFALQKTCGEGDKQRNYMLIADAGVPLGEAYDVCHEFLAEIVKLADSAAKRAKQENKEGDDKEE